jgi:UDP-GlcNAc:undecaprenyl-phosphate/decaprenyl-phosphate GlcNAc-1-phosphate transferase
MKLKWFALLGLVLLAEQACDAKTTVLKTEKDKVSYSVGVSVARTFKQQGIDVDVNLVVKGLKDALAGQKLLLSEDELRKIMTAYHQELRQKQMQTRKMAVMDNRKEEENFLAENKKKEGVITLPSGLQYKILKAAEGKKPTEEDSVEVKYRGTFINGTEFDSSGAESLTFKVAEVISGWRQALQLMPVGSKWQLFVPSSLAYGEKGLGQAITPNTMLIFEIELDGIKSSGAEPGAVKK